MKVKFGHSLSTTHFNSKLNTSASSLSIKRVKPPHDLKNPYPEPIRYKFPSHPIRKQTDMTMLHETTQKYRKPTKKVFSQAYMTETYSQHSSPVKKKNPGLFNCISRQSLTPIIENRSFEDLGIKKNKKGNDFKPHPKSDPIMIGEKRKQIKQRFQRVWREDRKYRDYGERMKDKFVWNHRKNKGYLDRYQAAKVYAK